LTENTLLFIFPRQLRPTNNSSLSHKTLRQTLGFSTFPLREAHDFKGPIFKNSFGKKGHNNVL